MTSEVKWPKAFSEMPKAFQDKVKYQISTMAIGDAIEIKGDFQVQDLFEIADQYGIIIRIRGTRNKHKIKRVRFGEKRSPGINLGGVI